MASSDGGESRWVIVRSAQSLYSVAGKGKTPSVLDCVAPEQSHRGHLAIPLVGSGGFGGLLANSNLFQRIRNLGECLVE